MMYLKRSNYMSDETVLDADTARGRKNKTRPHKSENANWLRRLAGGGGGEIRTLVPG